MIDELSQPFRWTTDCIETPCPACGSWRVEERPPNLRLLLYLVQPRNPWGIAHICATPITIGLPMRANPSVKERAPWPPRRSRAEERRLQGALMYDFEVVVPTRTTAGGGGKDRNATRGAYGWQPPLTNYRFLGIDELVFGSLASANFALSGFCEVRPYGVFRSSPPA